jgi:hypothetical protein
MSRSGHYQMSGVTVANIGDVASSTQPRVPYARSAHMMTIDNTKVWRPCKDSVDQPCPSAGQAGFERAMVVDGYTWSRVPGTDVEVRALTNRPLALRYRSSLRHS